MNAFLCLHLFVYFESKTHLDVILVFVLDGNDRLHYLHSAPIPATYLQITRFLAGICYLIPQKRCLPWDLLLPFCKTWYLAGLHRAQPRFELARQGARLDLHGRCSQLVNNLHEYLDVFYKHGQCISETACRDFYQCNYGNLAGLHRAQPRCGLARQGARLDLLGHCSQPGVCRDLNMTRVCTQRDDLWAPSTLGPCRVDCGSRSCNRFSLRASMHIWMAG